MSDSIIEALESVLFPGRSSKYGFRRHGIMHAASYLRILSEPPRTDSAAIVRRARALRILGRPEEALREFNRALKGDFDNAAALAWRWELRFGDARKAGALSPFDIDRAIVLEPHNRQWRLLRSLRYIAKPFPVFREEYREALKDLEEALALDPHFMLTHALLAVTYRHLERFDKAIEHADAAICLETGQAWLYRFRSFLQLRLKNTKGFVADCEQTILLDEGAGYFRSALNEPSSKQEATVRAADRYLARHKKAYWMYVLRGDSRRSPEVNDFSGGLEDFYKALALNPNCSWGWAYLARALMMNGAFAEAMKAIGKALKLKPQCGWFYIWRGEMLRRQGDFAGSIADFSLGLALDPDYELGYAWRGGAKLQMKKSAAALKDLDLAAKLNPSHSWTIHERSRALRNLGRIAEALKDVESACRLDPKYSWCSRPDLFKKASAELDAELRRDPKCAWAYAWRGDIKIRMREYPGAEADLRKALKIRPDLAWVRAWLGRALESQGLRLEALAELSKAVRLDPNYANSFAWRGRLLHQMGDRRAALADLKKASELDPKSAWVWAWKGEAQMSFKRWNQAQDDLSRAIELDSRNFDAFLARAEVRRKLRDAAGAQSDIKAASILKPEDVRVNLLSQGAGIKADLALAREFSAKGRHAEAVRLCGEILSRDSKSEDALLQRSDAFRCLGEYKRSVADLDLLVALRKGDGRSRLSRGVARRTAMDFSGALEDAEAVLRKGVDRVAAHILKSEALRNLGRCDEAVEAATAAIKSDPKFGWAYVVRAKAQRQSGWLEKALEDTNLAFRLNSRDAKALGWRGDIMRKLGRGAEALEALNLAVAIDPTCAWVLALRGEVRREAGELEKGFEDVKLAMRIDANCSCSWDIVGNDPPNVRKDPMYAWVYAWRGGIHRRLEHWQAAAKDLNLALELDQKCFWARAWRGEMELARGNFAAAGLDLTRALENFPNYADAHVWLGKLFCQTKKCGQARKAFQKALDLDPLNIWGLIGIGVCLDHSGRAPAARAFLMRAREVAPGLFDRVKV